jgi:hypothetical protein
MEAKMTAELLQETARIVQGRTRMLPTAEHLEVLVQLLREARAIINEEDEVGDLRDWEKTVGVILDENVQ